MICEIEAERLRTRGHEICDMLVPLAGSVRLAYGIVPYRSELTIGVHAGSRPNVNIRDWRFSTIARGIRAAYYERWAAVDEKRQHFYIQRAYLHLYRGDRHELAEAEIMALHCDPNEPDDSGLLRHAMYKRGPHIHVSAAEHPFPHSHFALNVTELDNVLSSIGSLHAAVRSGVVLLRDQVLDVIDTYGLYPKPDAETTY